MNKSRYVARGGLLTALSVLFLYLACLFPMVRLALCAAGGIVPAMPLAHRRVKLGVSVYLATSVLAVVILPQKIVALEYFAVFGVYTLVKYAIEKLHGRGKRGALKALFATADGALLWGLFRFGFLSMTIPPMFGGLSGRVLALVVIAGWYAVFIVYDFAFSQLIAQLRRIFPAD